MWFYGDMNTLYAHRAVLRRHLVALVGVALCVYFTYHILQGNRGVLRLMAISSSIDTMSQINTSLHSERDILEKKVQMMRPGQVDRDFLDERVRLTLGYSGANEISVLYN